MMNFLVISEKFDCNIDVINVFLFYFKNVIY